MRAFGIVASTDRAGDSDDRIAFSCSRDQSRGQVGSAGTRCYQHDPGLSRDAADSSRNERRILLMPANDKLRPIAGKLVIYPIYFGSGDAEDLPDTLLFQTLYGEC